MILSLRIMHDYVKYITPDYCVLVVIRYGVSHKWTNLENK